MKKFYNWFLVLLVCCAGCTNNQSSSLEEAQYVASQQLDFGSLIQAISVSSGITLILSEDPFLWQTNPEMKSVENSFVHLIIYETKDPMDALQITTMSGVRKKTVNKKCYLLILNDERPPKIVIKKEIFSGTVLID